MKELNSNKSSLFKVLFASVSVIVFIIIALRSYLVPFNHDETATFFFFIQSGNYMPFHSAVDANNHVLNSFLGNICFHLFGSSPFALRIPNLIGLVILIFATYKISKHLNQIGSKLLLTATFLLSYHWLTFFGACRGYGLSLALLIMGIAFMLEFINASENRNKFLWTLLFFQLAISSNLILIIVVLLLSGIMFVIQITNKKINNPVIIGAWLLHFAAIYYWLSFSFYLQEGGALYYGAGDSYWSVTFVTLIQLLVGTYSAIVKWIVLGLVTLVAGLFIFLNKSNLLKIKQLVKLPDFSILFFIIFWSLVIGFYLMNKLFNVNFPEDRTGLFFYVFFALWLCFTIDKLSLNSNKIVGFSLTGVCVIHFMLNFNFRKHSLSVYETIPEHFYTTLLKEQEKSKERITIGGHRVRELFYGFFNYRYGGELNPADPTEVMQMNCDYYIATKLEEKYFKDYYDIIDTEPDWGFVVLKRKEKIKRNLVIERKDILLETNDAEFLGIYDRGDTAFANSNPIIAEINFDVLNISKPTNTWIVLAVNDSLDQQCYFKRYPLQWTGYNLNGKKNLTYSLITGTLPPKSKKMVCFIWNIGKKPYNIKVNSFKIYQIEGNGVNYMAPDIK
jgi:hypothetical protein